MVRKGLHVKALRQGTLIETNHRAFARVPHLSTPLTEWQQAPLQTLGGNEDEAAAMAAMFQAQTANWEETQEKMSQ